MHAQITNNAISRQNAWRRLRMIFASIPQQHLQAARWAGAGRSASSLYECQASPRLSRSLPTEFIELLHGGSSDVHVRNCPACAKVTSDLNAHFMLLVNTRSDSNACYQAHCACLAAATCMQWRRACGSQLAATQRAWMACGVAAISCTRCSELHYLPFARRGAG